MLLRQLLAPALALGAVSGCAGQPGAGVETVQSKSDARSSVSAACDDAMVAAEVHTGVDRAEPTIVASLDACGSPQEWLTALQLHPGAINLTDVAWVGDVHLRTACHSFPDTAVCRQAAVQGILG